MSNGLSIAELREAITAVTTEGGAWGKNMNDSKEVMLRIGDRTYPLQNIAASFEDGHFVLMLTGLRTVEDDRQDRTVAERLLDQAASLIMAVDTNGPGGRIVVMPDNWFNQTNDLLSRYRAVRAMSDSALLPHPFVPGDMQPFRCATCGARDGSALHHDRGLASSVAHHSSSIPRVPSEPEKMEAPAATPFSRPTKYYEELRAEADAMTPEPRTLEFPTKYAMVARICRAWAYNTRPSAPYPTAHWMAKLGIGPIPEVWACSHSHETEEQAWACTLVAARLLADGEDPGTYEW
jgi:hypothetical protein